MTKIAIVTYVRGKEILTPELIEIGNQLRQHYPHLAMELYYESDIPAGDEVATFPIRKNAVRGTKYRKLLHALQAGGYDYLLSLDNDIAANIPALLNLVDDTISGQCVLGWGRVHSRHVTTFLSHLVKVDKLLSHNVLRPALWRFHVGVTIPGQCFLLKTATFRDKLPPTDTFLDDLSIGLHAAKHKLHYHYAEDVVAFELPSYSFSTLWKQRARWAIGFKQSLSCPTLTRQDRQLLWIHAFAYHFLPLLHFGMLAFLSVQQPLLFACLLGVVAGAVAKNHPQSIAPAVAYQLVFPLFHLGWLFNFLKVKK